MNSSKKYMIYVIMFFPAKMSIIYPSNITNSIIPQNSLHVHLLFLTTFYYYATEIVA